VPSGLETMLSNDIPQRVEMTGTPVSLKLLVTGSSTTPSLKG